MRLATVRDSRRERLVVRAAVPRARHHRADEVPAPHAGQSSTEAVPAAGSWSSLALLLMAIVLAVFCGSVVHPRIFIVAAALLAILIVGLLGPWLSVCRLRGELSFPQRRSRVGRKIHLHLELCSGWPWSIYGLVVRGGWAPGHGRRRDGIGLSIPRLPGGRTTTTAWSVPATRRGVFPSAEATIRSGFPFGFWECGRRLESTGSVIIWPEIFDLGEMHDPIGSVGRQGDATSRRAGGTGEFHGTRPHVPGESLRWIHWRQTARHDRLIVCERSRPASLAVEIVLETSPSGGEVELEADPWETGFSIAASLAVAWVRSGVRVRLRFESAKCYDAQTRADLTPALDAMARFVPKHGASLAELLAAAGPRFDGPQVAITTPRGLSRLGREHFPCPGRQLLLVGTAAEIDAVQQQRAAILGARGAMIALRMPDPELGNLRKIWREIVHGS